MLQFKSRSVRSSEEKDALKMSPEGKLVLATELPPLCGVVALSTPSSACKDIRTNNLKRLAVVCVLCLPVAEAE